jgi:N-methylhydantoinase A
VIADLRYDFSQTVDTPIENMDVEDLRAVFRRHIDEGKKQLAQNEALIGRVVATHHIDMCFLGQIHPMRVAVEAGWSKAQIEAAFLKQYARDFGSPLEGLSTVLVTLRTSVAGVRPRERRRASPVAPRHVAQPRGYRPVYFGGWIDTPIYQRQDLEPGMHFQGPAIVEQSDTTTVIEPNMKSRVDSLGNLIVEMR